MTKTLQQRREISVAALDDAIQLIWRASKSRIEILGEDNGNPNQYIIPAQDAEIFGAFQVNANRDIGTFAQWAGISTLYRMEAGSLGVNQLVRAIYSPSGRVSEARKNFPLMEVELGNWFWELENGQLFWPCIDYLKTIDHPARFDTLINERARANASLQGLDVIDSFYTAPHRDGWNNGEPVRPIDLNRHFLVNIAPNHNETYLVVGKGLGIDEPAILIRTGNGAAGIRPVVRAVDETGKVAGYAAYQTRGLPKEISKELAVRLGLDFAYNQCEEMAKGLKR